MDRATSQLVAPKTIAAEERRRAAALPGMEDCARMLGMPPGSGGELLDLMDQYIQDGLPEYFRKRYGLGD